MGGKLDRVATLALLAGLMSAGAAFAQDNQSNAADQGAYEEEAITVVARRRAESLDQVPSSADVVTGRALQEAAVENGKDLSRMVAGVQVLDNGTGMNDEMIIRGEGGTRQNNIEPGSGLYRNGVFIAGGNVGGRNFVGIDFFDVEQVEILRGPQGAYFGRNAIGGAINIISARPTGENSLDLRADIGSQERYGAEAVGNFSLGAVDFRLGGFYAAQDDGWYTSSITGRTLDYSERSGVRLSAATDIGSSFSLYGLVEYSEEDAPAPQVFEYTLATNDPPINNPGPTGYSVDRFDKALSFDPRQTRDTFNALVQANWDLGWAELVSITGYRERTATSLTDGDFNTPQAVTRALTAVNSGEETFGRFVQDTRLQSTGDGVRWLIGLEYNKVDSDFETELLPEVPTTLPPGCAGGVCTLAVAQGTARSVYRAVDSEVDDTSWALYGALGWTLGSNWELSVDFRYTEDDKNFTSIETRRLDNPATPANEQVQLFINRSRVFQVFTPGVSLSYLTPGGGSIYGRIATGYRGGGFNNDPGEPNDGVSNIALPASFDPEYVTSFELGTKGRFAEGVRYEFNAYYNIKQDAFVNYAVWAGCPTAAPRPGCATNSSRNVGLVQNVGDAVQYGVEASIRGLVRNPLSLPGRFTYGLNLAWADGEYEEGFVWANSNTAPAATLTTNDISGNRLGRLREVTGNLTLGYAAPIAGGLVGYGNVSFRGEFGGFEDPGNNIPYDDVFLVDATLGVRSSRWTLALIGKNVLDNEYYNISPLNQTFGVQSNQPVTWMLRATSSF